jgi:hypothetical protein
MGTPPSVMGGSGSTDAQACDAAQKERATKIFVNEEITTSVPAK